MRRLILSLLLVAVTGCLQTRRSIKEDVKITPAEQKKAQDEAEIMENEEQIRILRGQIENLENSMRLMSEAKNHREVELAEMKTTYEERLKVYAETIAKLQDQYLALSQKVETINGAKVAVANAKASKSGNPFDTAEALFNQKKWREAIVEYQNYRDRYPNGKTYSEATYKIGVCFQELGMKDEAKSFYNEVVKRFSKTKAADKARYRLKNLK